MSDPQQNDIDEKVVFGTAAIDETDRVFEPSRPVRPTRRRGRPPGAKTRSANTHITADEFAVLRAVAQGIDVGIASRQYLLWTGRVPERGKLLENYGQLLARVEASAMGLEDAATAREMIRDLLGLQTVSFGAAVPNTLPPQPLVAESLPLPAPDASAPPERPSLEEFAQQFDEDMFSEDTLVEMYAEAYPEGSSCAVTGEGAQQSEAVGQKVTPSDATDAKAVSALAMGERAKRLLTAIDWLDSHLGRRPSREDQIEQWLRINPKQRQAFNGVGVLSIGNLVDWMALRGDDWYDSIPGYGVSRAGDIRLWLARWNICPAQGLTQRASLPEGDTASAARLVPVSQMNWPEHLRGDDGALRTRAPNSLGASNDIEAVNAWFQIIRQKSGATQVAYRRAIERLLLWTVNVRHVSLSSMTLKDLLAFKDFLSKPPENWVQKSKSPRKGKTQEWRPLRGALSDKSLEVTFAAISSMYRRWHKGGYITSDPADGIVGSKRKDAKLDVMRSFSEQQREVIGRTFAEMKDGYAKRRLTAIIRILESAGLRREELETAKWGHLSRLRIDGRDTEQWSLKVDGKGKRVRNVPINSQAYEALLAHKEDRLGLQASGVLYMSRTEKEDEMPLIGLLDERWIEIHNKILAEDRSSRPKSDADAEGSLKTTVNQDGGLSAAAIYSILKQFFRKCSEMAGEPLEEKNTPFKRASTHWLRHTFAHHVLKATGKDLAVTQTLLGHSSINTTAIYVKADMEARAAAVNAVRPSV